MEKCKILSQEFNTLEDIDGVLSNLISEYLFSEGFDPKSLALSIKEQILEKYVKEKFKETYSVEEDLNTLEVSELLGDFIKTIFYNELDPYSALMVPSIEEILLALDGNNTFVGTNPTEKDLNVTDRIERDNEGSIIRKHLANRFMDKAFFGSTKIKNYAINFGTYGLLSAAVIDRKNGNSITSNQDINDNLKLFLEELFLNIIKFAKDLGENPTVTTLYDSNGNPTSGLRQLSDFISRAFNSTVFNRNKIEQLYNSSLIKGSNNSSLIQLMAYTSYILLNNFDSFIKSYSPNIEINEKYFGRRTKENKYRLGSKGTNMNQTWRTSSEIFVVDEIDDLTKNLINTTPMYAYNSNTPLVDSYINYQLFITQICSIKEALSSFAENEVILAYKSKANSLGDRIPVWNLSDDVKKFTNGKSIKEILALTSSEDSEMAWISIFEILSNSNNPRLKIFKHLTLPHMAIILSAFKGIFDRSNPTSIVSLCNNNKTIKNYFEYILQNITSVFPIKFILYAKRGEETYARNILDLVQSRARRNLENSINTRNSKISMSLMGDYDISKLAKPGNVTNKIPLYVTITPPYIDTTLLDSYVGSVYIHGDQHVALPSHHFMVSENNPADYHYKNLKPLFTEVLTLNLNDARLELALFALYLDYLGNINYQALVSDLYNMSMRILGNQYVSNVELAGLKTKQAILSKLSRLFPTNPPRPNESLGEIPLFSLKDYNTLEKLSIAYVNSRLNLSFTLVVDGENNASSTNTLSNLQSNYAVLFLEQIKRNENAAAKNFSVIRDGFVTLFRQKELYDEDNNSTKLTTDFNTAEFVQSLLIQNFLDGLVDYTNKDLRISNSIYPVKDGKVGILPSVNSDKPFIGLLLANLNLALNPYNKKSITWRELLKDPNFDPLMFGKIQEELGDFFSTAIRNINSELERAFTVAEIPYENLGWNKSCDNFKPINDWAEATGKSNIVDYILNKVNDYNHTNAGRINPIQLIDLVHFINNKGKLAVNSSLLSLFYIHNNSGLFSKFILVKESLMLKDLIKGKVSLYTASMSSLLFDAYKALRGLIDPKKEETHWEQNGEMILAKITIKGKPYPISKLRDIRVILKELNAPIDLTKNIDLLRNYGELTLNPFLHKYNILDYFITTEWNYATVGSYYAHPNKKAPLLESFSVANMKTLDGQDAFPAPIEADNAARVDASFKRNVAYTAAMHIFLLGTVDGIPSTYNVAVIDDLTTQKYNITGEISEVSPTDGGMFVNPFIVYLENNSLKGERVGINKKQFCHAYDANTGTQVIIKTAGFGITNETMRMSTFDLNLMYKMTKGTWLSLKGEPLVLNILSIPYVNDGSSDGAYYFKENGNYYKLRLDSCINLGNNIYKRVVELVKPDGTATGETIETTVAINSNFELHNFFGGFNSMNLLGNKLVWSEASIEAVVTAMNSIGYTDKQEVAKKGMYQPLKHSDIHYACGAGAVKCGAANMNHKDAFDVDDPNYNREANLNFMRVRMNQTGVQLDKEHLATGEDLSLMTLVVSACVSRGYTLQEAIEMYEGLAQLSRQETKNFSEVKDLNDLEKVIVQTILNQASKSSLNNSTLENLVLPLLDKLERGETITLEDILNLKIPYSDNSVYNKIISMCSVELTRKGIRAKIDGLLAVLCPSHNRIKLYGNRLKSSWDNTDNLPKNAEGNPITLDELLYNMPPILHPSDLEMGRSYNVQYTDDSSSEIVTLNLPSDYQDLRNAISSGKIKRIVENVKVGRNLGSYNCRFLDSSGHRWQLYDLASTMDLYLVKELMEWDPATVDLTDAKVLKKLREANRIYVLFDNNKPYPEFTRDNLETFLNWFKTRPGVPKHLRRLVLLDLNAISKGGRVRIYGSEGFISVLPGTMETLNYEAVLPKKFAEEFGLEVNDDLDTISKDKDFFTKRLIQKLQLNQGMIPLNYDVSFKRISGKHIYVINKNNLPNTIGLELKENVHTITDSSENIIRMDDNYKELYSMSSNKDVIYVDASGNEIIATDNVKYYVDNLQYTNVEFSGNNIKENVAYLKDSDNKTASNLYEYYVANDENLEELSDDSLLEISKDLNSALKLSTSSAFKYILTLGRDIHTSFLRSLDIVAARIPAQSMQSFMAMKIAAFIESDINTAYVSTDQIWLLGSDYDIDAVSLAMFSINSTGKYATWSPYMDLSSIEQLKKSENLPLPTGRKITITANKEGIDITPYLGTLFRIGQYEVLLNNNGKTKKILRNKVQLIPSAVVELSEFLRMINELGDTISINWGSLKKQKELSESLLEIINKHNLYLTKLKSKSAKDNAVKNFNMSKMFRISDNPINLIESSQSVDSTTGEPESIANNSPVALEQKTHTYGNFINKALAIIENQVGKKCVGIAANGLKAFFALTEYYNKVLNDPNIPKKDKERLRFRSKFGRELLANVFGPNVTDPNLRLALNEVDLDTDAAIILSALLSLATDNAKKLSLAKLNAGVNMLGTYVYGIIIGMSFKEVSDIMMSAPALLIRDLMLGNSFDVDLKMTRVDLVFDYLELGPKSLLKALDGPISSENHKTYISSLVFDQIKKIYGEIGYHGNPEAPMSNENYIATLVSNYLDSSLRQQLINNLEVIKTNLYNSNERADYRWKLVRYVDFLLDYVENVNTIKENQRSYNNFKVLALGALEVRTLGLLLSLNLGIPSGTTDLISKITSIEEIINNLSRINLKEETRKSFHKNEGFNTIQKTDNSFSLIDFVKNKLYRDALIQKYNSVKNTFNILDTIVADPQYFEYLSRLADSYNSASISVRTRATKVGTHLATKLQGAYNAKDIQDITKLVNGLISELLINYWLADSYNAEAGINYGKFELPENLYLYTVDRKGQRVQGDKKKTALSINLGTEEGLATFCAYMETYVIPRILRGKDKSNHKSKILAENKFLQSLKPMTFNLLYEDRRTTVLYSLPINMLPRTPDEKATFEEIKEDFDKLLGEEYNFGKHNLYNLFYLYNLIAFHNIRSESTLASLFDLTNTDIDKSKRTFINTFDKTLNIVFEGASKDIKKSDCDITTNLLIERTRLRRNPYTTTLKFIYAPDSINFGNVKWNLQEKENGMQEWEYGIEEEGEEFGPNPNKRGSFEKVNPSKSKTELKLITPNGFRVYYKNKQITKIEDSKGKTLKLTGITLTMLLMQEGGRIIGVYDKQKIEELIEQALNCRK